MRFNYQLRKEIVSRIIAASNPEKIILFGSYAYGKPGNDSDLDLLVVTKERHSKIKMKKKIRQALYTIKLPKDIIITNPEEFNFYKEERGSVLREAALKGIVFYDKAV